MLARMASGRHAPAAALSSVAAALALAGSAAASPPPTPVAPPYPTRVTMISDSVGAILLWAPDQRAVLGQGLSFVLDADACRRIVEPGCFAYEHVPLSVLEVVRQRGPDLGYLVIVDIGYNDPADSYAEAVDEVMRALVAAHVERVVWVTLRESQANWVAINDQIRAAPRRWPQLTVADWAPVAEPHPEWFADLAHMNQAGGAAFAAFLRPIVLAACGSVCAHPPATAAMLAPTIESHTATLRWHGDASACTYDLETNVGRSAWRQVVTATTRTTLVVRRPVGPLLHARVRAHDEDGVAGSWSRPLRFRM